MLSEGICGSTTFCKTTEVMLRITCSNKHGKPEIRVYQAKYKSGMQNHNNFDCCTNQKHVYLNEWYNRHCLICHFTAHTFKLMSNMITAFHRPSSCLLRFVKKVTVKANVLITRDLDDEWWVQP